MITDLQNAFSVAQAITATAASTNIYDAGPFYAGNTKISLGQPGSELGLLLHVDTAFNSAGHAAVLTPTWETDDNAAFGSPATAWTIPSGAIAEASLTAGAIFGPYILPRGAIFERYQRLKYTVSGENFTAGKLNAYLVLDATRWTPQAPASIVSV